MAEALTYDLGVHALLEHQRRVRVPEVMEADRGEPSRLEEPPQASGERGGIHWSAGRIGEHEAAVIPHRAHPQAILGLGDPVAAEHFADGLRERDLTALLGCLGFAEDIAQADQALYRLHDRRLAAVEVQVRPRLRVPPRPPAIPPRRATLGELLSTYRQHARRTRDSIADEAGVDRSYVIRLEGGQRGHPSVVFVDALARALGVSPPEHDHLRIAAGYAPRAVLKLGHWDPILEEATQLLDDASLPLAERHAYCRELLRVCALYRRIARRRTRAVPARPWLRSVKERGCP
jgi:transcriptional regulator with XRE-family HTH domain